MSEQTIPERECTKCPPWVIRCAHFGDDFVQLCASACVPDAESAATWTHPFSVDVPPDAIGVAMGMVSMALSKHASESAATAAFAEAEARLLGREP